MPKANHPKPPTSIPERALYTTVAVPKRVLRTTTAVPERVLYTLAEAGHLLGGRSPASLYRDHAAGRLTFVKVGARTYIPAAEIERLAATAQQEAQL